MRFGALAVVATLASLAPLGCSSGGELTPIVGQNVDAATIDKDPIALLPSAPILFGYVDTATLFQTSLGPDVANVVTKILPLGPESNFDPKRDVTRIYAGIYAMQGADFAAVIQGNFDVDAIKRAMDAKAITMNGAPVVKSKYAEQDLYTVQNLGFTILTTHTALSGNETGMRRTLDRLRFGKLERSVPPWMIDFAATQGASFALAGDMTGQAPADAASKSLPFLVGLKNVRILGNFKSPGVNMAGTLSYPDPQSAQAAADALAKLQSYVAIASFFTSLGGIQLPVIQSQIAQSDVAITATMNEGSARGLLGALAGLAQRAVVAK